MSKLATALKHVDSKERVLIDQPRNDSVKTFSEPFLSVDGIARRYRVEARFGVDVLVTDEEMEYLPDAVHRAKRAIIEEVFGEFRPLLIEMQTAVYEKDTSRLRKLTAELEHKMFVEGL